MEKLTYVKPYQMICRKVVEICNAPDLYYLQGVADTLDIYNHILEEHIFSNEPLDNGELECIINAVTYNNEDYDAGLDDILEELKKLQDHPEMFDPKENERLRMEYLGF